MAYLLITVVAIALLEYYKIRDLEEQNELLKGQQAQYRRVLYENGLIPKEFVEREMGR